MYKGNSAALQRYHKVHEIDSRPVDRTVEDDLIPTAANMSYDECEVERRQLLLEKTKAENELVGAKATRDRQRIAALGHRLQGLCSRLGLLKRRQHELRSADSLQAFADAAKAIVPAEMLERVYERQQAILARGPA